MDLKIFWIGESQIVIFYLTYFIFSIIFYSTLTLFICLKKSINLGLFCLFGLIYIVIASVVLFSIKKDVLIFVFDLILFILEIFFYNTGLRLSFYRAILSHNENAWDILHIEVYRLYPLLFLCVYLF